MAPEPGPAWPHTSRAQLPYAPPTARVADPHAASGPQSHGGLRTLRVLAMAGSLMFVAAPLVGFTTGRSDIGFVTVCLVFFAVGVVSLNALAARRHVTWIGSLTIAANVAVALFWTWMLVVPPAGLSKGGAWVGGAYCAAASLNIVALLVLRRTAQRTVAVAPPAQTAKT